jgi:hypothetical protein
MAMVSRMVMVGCLMGLGFPTMVVSLMVEMVMAMGMVLMRVSLMERMVVVGVGIRVYI